MVFPRKKHTFQKIDLSHAKCSLGVFLSLFLSLGGASGSFLALNSVSLAALGAPGHALGMPPGPAGTSPGASSEAQGRCWRAFGHLKGSLGSWEPHFGVPKASRERRCHTKRLEPRACRNRRVASFCRTPRDKKKATHITETSVALQSRKKVTHITDTSVALQSCLSGRGKYMLPFEEGRGEVHAYVPSSLSIGGRSTCQTNFGMGKCILTFGN